MAAQHALPPLSLNDSLIEDSEILEAPGNYVPFNGPSTSSCWQTWSAGKIPPLCSRIVPFKPPFIGIIPMFYQWFSHDVTIQTSIYREFSYIVSLCIHMSNIFPWFSHVFPMIFLWFFYDVPMKTLISAGISRAGCQMVPGPAAAWALAPGSSSHGPTSQPAGGAHLYM